MTMADGPNMKLCEELGESLLNLKQLNVRQFRNYKKAELSFDH